MGFSGSDAGGFRWEGFDSGAPSQSKPPKPKKPRRQIKSPAARVLTNIAVTLAVGFLYFYFELPALNLQSPDFYTFVLLLCAAYCICAVFTSGFQGQGAGEYFKFVKKQCRIPFFLAIGMVALALVLSLIHI